LTVETEKARKYDLLAKEIGQIYNSSVYIIPYVFTWEGIVTKYHQRYKKLLRVEDHIEAYIQSLIVKKTFESISIDYRRAEDDNFSKRKSLIEGAEEKMRVETEMIVGS